MPRANQNPAAAPAIPVSAATAGETSASSAAATASDAAPARKAPAKRAAAKRVPNVAPQRTIEPLEHKIGQDHERTMKSHGPSREALEPARVEGVDSPVDKEWLDLMTFNQDELEVQIHTTTEKDAESVFEISVNGRSEFFRRGQKKKCQRMFVERMARAKITTFTQEGRRGDDGERFEVQIPHTGLRYPFSVLRDPHPRGADWLESILAQP